MPQPQIPSEQAARIETIFFTLERLNSVIIVMPQSDKFKIFMAL